MIPVVYVFGDFLLDPLTRELRRGGSAESLPVSTVDCLIYLVQHRKRSVGRDELAAAVWGRTDVSEASLTQAIMRLRRVIGAASCIRTTPRLGYRWAFEPTVERQVEPASPIEPPAAALVSAPPPRRKARGVGVAVAAACVVAVLAALAWWLPQRKTVETAATPSSSTATAPLAGMVLPAGVDAPGEWAWLRLGLMDLIANQLRDGGLTTTPSETTVGLINAKQLDADKLELDPSVGKVATLLVKPAVSQVGGQWNIRLSAQGPADTRRVVEAQGGRVA